MHRYYGFQLTSFNLGSDSSFIRCSFVGFRDGCINLEKNCFRVKLKYCCFIDNCAVGRNGGVVCITGENSEAKVAFCYATSCYTCPTNTNLAEGQFLFVNWKTSQIINENYHEISYLSVSSCAPLIHNNGREQRAPVYIGEGSNSSYEINISRSMSHIYSIFFMEKENAAMHNYITFFNCTTCGPTAGFLVFNSVLAHVALLHPFSYAEPGGLDMVNDNNFPNNVFFEESIFIFDKKTSNHFFGQNYSVTFKSCLLKNFNYDNCTIIGDEHPTGFTNIKIQDFFQKNEHFCLS